MPPIDNKWQHLQARIRGAKKSASEYFSVYLTSATAPLNHLRSVPVPQPGYLADPFLFHLEGQTWLAAEQFSYNDGVGRLVVSPVESDLEHFSFSPLKLDRSGHASFPYVFQHQNQTWLIPETCAARAIQLYRLDGSPPRAQLVKNLMEDIDAADTVLFAHDGLWWIITSIRTSLTNNSRYLAIFYCDDLFEGAWRAHPVNGAHLYLDLGRGTGRNGGRVFRFQDRLYRTIQISKRYYGEKATVMEITELGIERFTERPALINHPVSILTQQTSTHHVCQLDQLMVFDRRERAPRAGWAPWLAPVRKYTVSGCRDDDHELLRQTTI